MFLHGRRYRHATFYFVITHAMVTRHYKGNNSKAANTIVANF